MNEQTVRSFTVMEPIEMHHAEKSGLTSYWLLE